MSLIPQLFGLVGFGAAFAVYAVVLILVLASHPGTRQAYLMITALIVSMIWSGSTAYSIWSNETTLVWMPLTDAIRIASWVCVVAALLLSASYNQTARRVGTGVLILGAACLFSVVLATLAPTAINAGQDSSMVFLALLVLPLLGLLALEQVMRNAAFEQRRVVRPLAIGIGLILMLDVFSYSQIFVFPDINALSWQVRGAGNAIAAPFLLVAIKRQQEWERELFLSRQVVFHTASLVAAGFYLLALGLAGSVMRPFDGTARAALELGVLFAASMVFLYALFSTTLHRRFKVFIAKHFYRNRYDYRQEWLRLIGTLAGTSAEATVAERGVRALAEIIESPAGELWWSDEPGQPFEGCGAWGTSAPTEAIETESALVEFLFVSQWVIDTDEYVEEPGLYENAFEEDSAIIALPSIFVPLILGGELRGIVRLDRRSDLPRLSFEDHDLLKTAGKQVAVFIAQERVTDRLTETRQFEAFSRLTTFLMHDLKNMISQQELVVGNAKRFKHRPEFVDDAVRTIDASVKRMRTVLERLQTHGYDEHSVIINVRKLLQDVVSNCSDRQPEPLLESVSDGSLVEMNKDKLAMALTHAIRNAQDATPADGAITVSAVESGESLVIEICDSGVGMTADFVRDRLFRPFDTTKGAQGMGIGAYQIRETIRAAGGDVEVSSDESKGTSFRLKLPIAETHLSPKFGAAAL